MNIGQRTRIAEAMVAGGRAEVWDTDELYGEKGRFRLLQFTGEAAQGAMDLDDPGRIVFEYPRALLHLLEAGGAPPASLFMIGHGIGTLSRQYPDAVFRVAELYPEVLALSREWFGFARSNVAVGDGRELLGHEPDGAHDAVVLDAFTAKGTPRHLVSLEFAALAARKLRPGGLLLMNLTGTGARDVFIGAVGRTLREVFPHVRFFMLPSSGAADPKNIVAAASAAPILYQLRRMAGFRLFEPSTGFLLRDQMEQDGTV